MADKTCTKCRRPQPASAFYANPKSSDGLKSHCKACHLRTSRTSRIKRAFGLDAKAYEDLMAMQSGLCGICEKPFTQALRPRVDHSHETGLVRSLLCNRCNLVLGLLEEDVDLLRKAIAYILLFKRRKGVPTCG